MINAADLGNLPVKELQQLEKPSKLNSFFFNFRSPLNNNFNSQFRALFIPWLIGTASATDTLRVFDNLICKKQPSYMQ